MPCDTITTQTLSAALSKAVVAVLLEALKEQGWIASGVVEGTLTAKRGQQRLTWAAGVGIRITAPTQEIGEAAVKSLTVAYSNAAVTWAASRAGWQVKSTGENTMTVQRR